MGDLIFGGAAIALVFALLIWGERRFERSDRKTQKRQPGHWTRREKRINSFHPEYEGED